MEFSLYFFSANDQAPYQDRYNFILEAARYADRNDFYAIWTPERHFQEFGGSFPNPSVLSAALATVTEQLEIRAGSVAFPLHHPVRVAEEWSLVDQLSNGRVGLCIATGWHRGDFVLNPSAYAERRKIAFEGIQTIRKLWTGQAVDFAGVEGQTVTVRTFPRPVRKHLPIWLVHTQNPQTWLKAAELDANVLTLLNNFDRLKTDIANYRECRAKRGLDPSAGKVTVGLHTFVGESNQQVKEWVREPLSRYLSTFLKQRKADAKLQGESRDVSEAETATLTELAFEDLFEKRSLLGTLPKCADLVQRLKDIGVDEVAALIDFGLDFRVVLDALPQLKRLKEMFQPEQSKQTVQAIQNTSLEAGSRSEAIGPNTLDWYFQRDR